MINDDIVLYSWDVPGRDATFSGVTDDEDEAICHVTRLLRSSAPSGTHGTVRPVVLAPNGSGEYVGQRSPVDAWLDETSGAVTLVG